MSLLNTEKLNHLYTQPPHTIKFYQTVMHLFLNALNNKYKIIKSFDQAEIYNLGKREYIILFDPDIMIEPNCLLQIFRYLNKIDAKRILLCGHLYGMSSALLACILIVCFQSKEFYNYCQIHDLIPNELNILFTNYKFNFDQIEFSICGMAGFPIFFTDIEQFDTFFNYIQGRYLHLRIDEYEDSPYITKCHRYESSDYISLLNDYFSYKN